MLQISTWRRYKTKAMLFIKPWGWEEWVPCNVASMLAAVLTASPGPPITETADLRREVKSDPSCSLRLVIPRRGAVVSYHFNVKKVMKGQRGDVSQVPLVFLFVLVIQTKKQSCL